MTAAAVTARPLPTDPVFPQTESAGRWERWAPGLLGGWTVGLYYALGTLSINDPAGMGMPDTHLTMATGLGSTALMYTSAFNTPGEFFHRLP